MISTKSKYGIRALLYMALQGNEEKISIKEIAEKENISGRYLEQIFSTLKQGGIVKSLVVWKLLWMKYFGENITRKFQIFLMDYP